MSNNKITDFLSGLRIVEEVESPINGKLVVKRDLTWGTYIEGGGLTQSGGVASEVWETSLSKIRRGKVEIGNTLILGLGAGSIAKLVRKYWSDSKITGVDIDPVIVELGRKYFDLDKLDVEIVIADAYEQVNNGRWNLNSFDLICVDTYIGDSFPAKIESEPFIKGTRKLINKEGVGVFNRLYYGEKRAEAEKFEKKLERIFGSVERVYPEANVMFVCRK